RLPGRTARLRRVHRETPRCQNGPQSPDRGSGPRRGKVRAVLQSRQGTEGAGQRREIRSSRSTAPAGIVRVRSLARWIVAIPLLVLMVLFALSNTQPVRPGLFPLGQLPFDVPLSVAILIAMALGFLLGGLRLW